MRGNLLRKACFKRTLSKRQRPHPMSGFEERAAKNAGENL